MLHAAQKKVFCFFLHFEFLFLGGMEFGWGSKGEQQQEEGDMKMKK